MRISSHRMVVRTFNFLIRQLIMIIVHISRLVVAESSSGADVAERLQQLIKNRR